MGKKTEKFLFNQHIFDEPEIEEEEHEEPPPPTFSEEELETVRQTTHDRAFEQGKQSGLAESKASRDEQIAQVLKKIGHDASLLFAAEEQREKLFERESVTLASAIFEKIFPEQRKQHGFEELKKSISAILKKQEGLSEIRVEVHPDVVEGIRSHITRMNLQGGVQQRFDIVGNATLNELAVNIYWKDGGAIRDIAAIAEEIRTILHDTLAGEPFNSHDSNSDTTAENPLPQTPHATDSIQEEPIGTEPAYQEEDAIENHGMTDTDMEKPDE